MRKVLLASAVALLAVTGVAPLADAASVEIFYNTVGTSSPSALCSSRAAPTDLTTGYESGKCLRERSYDGYTGGGSATSTLSYRKLTCTEGGSVRVERFTTEGCSGSPAATLFTGRDKTCAQWSDSGLSTSGGSSSSSSTNAYVDCAASSVPTTVSGGSFETVQYFSDSGCSTPENDVLGLPNYSYRNVTGGCEKTSSSSTATYRSNGYYKLASGKGYLRISATDAECKEWTSLGYTPLNECVAEEIGSSRVNSLKLSYYRRTLSAVGKTASPVDYPPAGTHVVDVECTDRECSANCRTTGYFRAGVCEANTNNGDTIKSSKDTVSADGKFSVTSYYSDAACTANTRVRATAIPLGKATCGNYGTGSFEAASAPTGSGDVALAQLPLPPLAVVTYDNDAPDVAPACNRRNVTAVYFVEPASCQYVYALGSSGTRFTLNTAAAQVSSQGYDTLECGSTDGAPTVINLNTCNRTATDQYNTVTRVYSHRSSAEVQAGFLGTLGGWYSTNPADVDVGAAYRDAAEGVTPGQSPDLPGNPDSASSAHASAFIIVALAAVAALFAR